MNFKNVLGTAASVLLVMTSPRAAEASNRRHFEVSCANWLWSQVNGGTSAPSVTTPAVEIANAWVRYHRAFRALSDGWAARRSLRKETEAAELELATLAVRHPEAFREWAAHAMNQTVVQRITTALRWAKEDLHPSSRAATTPDSNLRLATLRMVFRKDEQPEGVRSLARLTRSPIADDVAGEDATTFFLLAWLLIRVLDLNAADVPPPLAAARDAFDAWYEPYQWSSVATRDRVSATAFRQNAPARRTYDLLRVENEFKRRVFDDGRWTGGLKHPARWMNVTSPEHAAAAVDRAWGDPALRAMFKVRVRELLGASPTNPEAVAKVATVFADDLGRALDVSTRALGHQRPAALTLRFGNRTSEVLKFGPRVGDCTGEDGEWLSQSMSWLVNPNYQILLVERGSHLLAKIHLALLSVDGRPSVLIDAIEIKPQGRCPGGELYEDARHALHLGLDFITDFARTEGRPLYALGWGKAPWATKVVGGAPTEPVPIQVPPVPLPWADSLGFDPAWTPDPALQTTVFRAMDVRFKTKLRQILKNQWEIATERGDHGAIERAVSRVERKPGARPKLAKILGLSVDQLDHARMVRALTHAVRPHDSGPESPWSYVSPSHLLRIF